MPKASAARPLFSIASVNRAKAPPAESPVMNTAFGSTG